MASHAHDPAPIFNLAHHAPGAVNEPTGPTLTIVPGVGHLTTVPVRPCCPHRVGCANQISHLSCDQGLCYTGWKQLCLERGWDPQLCKELNLFLDAEGFRDERFHLDLTDLMTIFPDIVYRAWKTCKCVSPSRKAWVRPRNYHVPDEEYEYDGFVVPDEDDPNQIEVMVSSWFA